MPEVAVQTRGSRRDLLQRAAEGDVAARLQCWSPRAAPPRLGTVFVDNGSTPLLRVLEGRHANKADIVRLVLEHMAESAEEHALHMAMVWRYAQAHEMWKHSTNPELRTESAFLNSLDGCQTIRICVQFGTSTDTARRGKINIIERSWGKGWYDEASRSGTLPNKDRGAAGLSKGLLAKIADMSYHVKLEKAIQLWKQVIHERRQIGSRRSAGWKNATIDHLLTCDFERLIQLDPGLATGRALKSRATKRQRDVQDDEVLELQSSTGTSSSTFCVGGEVAAKKEVGREHHGSRDASGTTTSQFASHTTPRSATKPKRISRWRHNEDDEDSSSDVIMCGTRNDTSQNDFDQALDVGLGHDDLDVTLEESLHAAISDDIDFMDFDLQLDYTKTSSSILDTDVLGSELHTGVPSPYYRDAVKRLLDKDQLRGSSKTSQRQYTFRKAWLAASKWASVFRASDICPDQDIAPLDTADIWHLSWESFKTLSDQGHIVKKPIVLKQAFQDTGLYSIEQFLEALAQNFPTGTLDIQDGYSGKCAKVPVKRYCESLRKERTDTQGPTMSNAINLSRLVQADRPLLTRLSRFDLLFTLVNRCKGLAGKSMTSQSADVQSSLGFNLLGFPGAFSPPHLDALVGTWVRCLVGSKLWIFMPDMDEGDWLGFTQQGAGWCPRRNTARAFVLEKDDVLIMPPGTRVVHSVFTLEPSLMDGGMLWDELAIPEILDGLLWLINNQDCTNEALPYQLPEIIEALEGWINENAVRLQEQPYVPDDYRLQIVARIRNLRSKGCRCGQTCLGVESCICAREKRRCTTWCRSHPSLPPHLRETPSSSEFGAQSFQCMIE